MRKVIKTEISDTSSSTTESVKTFVAPTFVTPIFTHSERLRLLRESLSSTEAPHLKPKLPLSEMPRPEKKVRVKPATPTRASSVSTIPRASRPNSHAYAFQERLKQIQDATSEKEAKTSVIDDPVLKNIKFKENRQTIIDLQNRTFKNADTQRELEELLAGRRSPARSLSSATLQRPPQQQKHVAPIVPTAVERKPEPTIPRPVPKPKPKPQPPAEKPLTEFQKKMMAAAEAKQKRLIEAQKANAAAGGQNDGKPMKLSQRMSILLEQQKKDEEKAKNDAPVEMKKLQLNNFHTNLNVMVEEQFKKKMSMTEEDEELMKFVPRKQPERIKKEVEQEPIVEKKEEERPKDGIPIRRTARKRNTRGPTSLKVDSANTTNAN
ncbi:hypothetical protein GPJ56_006086 [Histomonas meleagridis]|nr:hypothetical protein GPJ56_006086 [Histomonas meleagridis]